jgi:hypothetical protein
MIRERPGPNAGEIIPEEMHRRYTPLAPALFPVTAQPVYETYDSVLANAGANARLDSFGNWVSNSDVNDLRLIADVHNGTGPSRYTEITEPGDIGVIDLGTAYADTDHDGMPDDWESVYGLDPNDDFDGPLDYTGDGYTNLEEFLNGGAMTTTFEYAYRLESRPTAHVDGSGMIGHMVTAVYRVAGSGDPFDVAPTVVGPKTINVPLTEMRAINAMSTGSAKNTAYKQALASNLNTQNMPVIGWDEVTMSLRLNNNLDAPAEADIADEYITGTLEMEYPVPFQY